MPRLNWISDENLEKSVSQLLEKAKEAQKKSGKKFGKNVIDPFSALFEMSGFEIDFNTWLKSETTRQAQKALQNHIGDFHQNILGSCMEWTNMKTGHVIDLVSESNKLIAEIKNKFNTIPGGKLADLYYSLEGLVMPKNSIFKGFTAYYVPIIPKKSNRYDKVFTPSDKAKGERCSKNDKIRETDGASFYKLVTKDPNALENLFNVLPDAILECSKGIYKVSNFDVLKEFFKKAFE